MLSIYKSSSLSTPSSWSGWVVTSLTNVVYWCGPVVWRCYRGFTINSRVGTRGRMISHTFVIFFFFLTQLILWTLKTTYQFLFLFVKLLSYYQIWLNIRSTTPLLYLPNLCGSPSSQTTASVYGPLPSGESYAHSLWTAALRRWDPLRTLFRHSFIEPE